MENQLTGTIKTILDAQEGTSKAGKSWKKIEFVIENNEGYEGKAQIFAFEIFGEEKVDKFLQFNSVGKLVDVSYNIGCNEWNGKYFTSLSAWKVFGAESTDSPEVVAEVESVLPF